MAEIKEIVLPTERRKAVNYNPKLLVLFGKPKSGKSSAVASLDDNLIVDLEDGYRALEVMVLQARSVRDMYEIRNALHNKYLETGKFPYRYITVDNATRLEEIALPLAADYYRNTPMGQAWGYKKDSLGMNILKDGKPVPDPKADVRMLTKGAGYLYLRNAVKTLVRLYQPYCETLILICHTKDSQITTDEGENVIMSVDLAGKLSDIICGEADAVGYVYRAENKTVVSFDGGEGSVREARPLHMRGRKFVVGESDENNVLTMNLSKIFIDDKG